MIVSLNVVYPQVLSFCMKVGRNKDTITLTSFVSGFVDFFRPRYRKYYHQLHFHLYTTDSLSIQKLCARPHFKILILYFLKI